MSQRNLAFLEQNDSGILSKINKSNSGQIGLYQEEKNKYIKK